MFQPGDLALCIDDTPKKGPIAAIVPIHHLIRSGRRRILFLGGNDPEAQQRRRGYLDALAESGLQSDARLMARVEFELESAEAKIAHLLEEGVAHDERGAFWNVECLPYLVDVEGNDFRALAVARIAHGEHHLRSACQRCGQGQSQQAKEEFDSHHIVMVKK